MAATKGATDLPTPVKPPKERMSLDEFLAWLDEDVWAEWEDGEVIVLSPASYQHQDIFGFLYALIRFFVELYDLGIVLAAPFAMRLPKSQRVREPDLLVVLKEHLDRLRETYLDGAADLVVEIVSEESWLRDRGAKFAEYELDGVREYWLIDPINKRADFFVLGDDGRFQRRTPDAKGIYRSVVLKGFKLKVDWLWQEPLPKVSEALRWMRRGRR
jgi:Uma2 family endonuclease